MQKNLVLKLEEKLSYESMKPVENCQGRSTLRITPKSGTLNDWRQKLITGFKVLHVYYPTEIQKRIHAC